MGGVWEISSSRNRGKAKVFDFRIPKLLLFDGIISKMIDKAGGFLYTLPIFKCVHAMNET